MRTASDVLKDHMFSILDDVLVLLSGQGFPTPEKTYKLDGGWGLALSDLRRCFDKYRTRIAELEAERDNAVRYTELLIQERDNAKSKELEVLRLRIAELEAASAKDREWVGRALDKQKEYLEQCQVLIAERDAAKAGEARAVQAIKGIGEKARWSVIGDWSLNVGDYLRDEIEGIVFTLDTQPALDWLAQQRREAAARELEALMESEWKWEEFGLKAGIHARIGALTTQQPTACSRSEVRGKERL